MPSLGIIQVVTELDLLVPYVITTATLSGCGGFFTCLRMPWLIKEAGYD